MTGSEHYKLAEQLLNSADVAIGQYEEHDDWVSKRHLAENLTAQAHAHATLALAYVASEHGFSD